MLGVLRHPRASAASVRKFSASALHVGSFSEPTIRQGKEEERRCLMRRDARIWLWILLPRLNIASSETWTLATKDENNPRIFERQILRKIFGIININNT
jgi:hypothetical protein